VFQEVVSLRKILILILLWTSIAYGSGNFEISDGDVRVLSPDGSRVISLFGTGTGEFGQIVDNGLTGVNVYADGTGLLTSTIPSTGTLGFWTRTTGPALITTAAAGDGVLTTGTITGGTFTDSTATLTGGDLTNLQTLLFDTSVTPASEPEGQIWWNADDHVLNMSSGLGPVQQVGEEIWMIAKNETGVQIDDGKIVFIGGVSSGRPTITLAKADNPTTADRTIGFATMDIPDSTLGIVTTFGEVRDIDTVSCSPGDQLYLSATSAGGFTNVQPEYPNYIVKVGTCEIADASVGMVLVSVVGRVEDILDNGWNGGFLESINFTVSSAGGVITGTLENSDGVSDLTENFSDGFTVLDVTSSPVTVVLTAGADDNPQDNLVYILKSGKTTLVTSSAWPSTEHIKVANVTLRTAATTLTDGALVNRNWNDHIASSSNSMGHIQHISEKLRKFESQWDTGVESSVIVANNNPAIDTVHVSTTSGVVYQVHPQGFPALSMPTDDIHIANKFGDEYFTTTNLATQTDLSDGTAIGSASFSFVIWGVQNRSGTTSHLMCNLPSGTYGKNSPELAVADAFNFTNYTIPRNFQGTGFLIARLTFIIDTPGTTWTLHDNEDLRGKLPNVAVGGGGAGGSGITTLLGLTDTPASFVANALARVNGAGTALEFSNVITGNYSWTGSSNADWSDEGKTITLIGNEAAALGILGNSRNWLSFNTLSNNLQIGNVTDNISITSLGTGLTTLGGNLLVDGGDIGITGDTDLIQLAVDEVTVNGDLGASGSLDVDGTVSIGSGATPLITTLLTARDATDDPIGNLLGLDFLLQTTGNLAAFDITGNNSELGFGNLTATPTGSMISYRARLVLGGGTAHTIPEYRAFSSAISGTFSTLSVTDTYSYYAEDASMVASSGSITNQYGVYIEDLVTGTSSNWSIFSLGGNMAHVGNMRIGDTTVPTDALEVNGVSVFGDGGTTDYTSISATGILDSTADTDTLGVGVTTFAIGSNVMTITGDGGGNTIATITGASRATMLTLIFVDANVIITDDNTHAADSVDLSAAFTSADDTTLQLIYDGTSWYETSRSVN